MWWYSDVCHRNNEKNCGNYFKYGMGSYGKPKAWCAGYFDKCSEACIALGGAADSEIVTNYISADGGKGPKAGALPPAKKSRGRLTNRNLRGLKRGMPDLHIGCPPTDGGGVKREGWNIALLGVLPFRVESVARVDGGA